MPKVLGYAVVRVTSDGFLRSFIQEFFLSDYPDALERARDRIARVDTQHPAGYREVVLAEIRTVEEE